MSVALDNGNALLDYVQIRKGVLLFYTLYDGNKKPKPIERTGLVTEQKVRRFKRYFSVLLQFSDNKKNYTKEGKRFYWRLNFITITLPAAPEKRDKIDSAFFLFRKKIVYHGLNYYLWRKELQPGTGNVHWHIVSNAWIDYALLQKLWNDSLKRHAPGTIKKFFTKHGHKNPPTTEVRAIRSVGKCMAYASKYLSKEDQPVNGNTFGISRALIAIRYPAVLVDDLTERPEFKTQQLNDFCWMARADYIELTEELKKYWSSFVDSARKALNPA
jgi:hypothetical protein